MSRAFSCVMLSMVIGLSGCGPKQPLKLQTYKTSGKLTVEGKPVGGLDVFLIPEGVNADPKHATHGAVGADGSFQLGTYSLDDGAPEGTFSVRVAESTAGPTKLPSPELRKILEAYETKTKTIPFVTIKPQDNNVLDPIDLKK